MRKEANIKQWKELYDVAIKIKQLRPWEYLWYSDIITIMPLDEDEPVYCSVLGRMGEGFGIGTYIGFYAINDFYIMTNNKDIPQEQLLRYQNNLMCYFGEKEDLSIKEHEIIKDLDINFSGENEWIYFRSFEKGYTPFLLDELEVLKLTEVFKHLHEPLTAINKGLKVDFANGKSLLHRYDKERELWINCEASAIIPEIEYPVLIIQDEILITRLNKKKIVSENLEIDIVYLNSVINDENYDKPILPKLCILADCTTKKILSHDILQPDNQEVDILFNTIISYIMQVGKPKNILVRDKYIESLLSDICKKINVGLKVKEGLEVIDNILKQIGWYGHITEYAVMINAENSKNKPLLHCFIL